MIEMTKPVVPAFAKFAERISVPFSPVVRAGDWVYVSGLAPINPETGGYDILPIDQQARRVAGASQELPRGGGLGPRSGREVQRLLLEPVLLRSDQRGLCRVFRHPQAGPHLPLSRRAGSVRSTWRSTAWRSFR